MPFALMTANDTMNASTQQPSGLRLLAGLWVLCVGSMYVLRRLRLDGGRLPVIRAACALVAIWCVPVIYGAWNYLKEVPDFARRPAFWIASLIAVVALVVFVFARKWPRDNPPLERTGPAV
jgi:hypothetical protein